MNKMRERLSILTFILWRSEDPEHFGDRVRWWCDLIEMAIYRWLSRHLG